MLLGALRVQSHGYHVTIGLICICAAGFLFTCGARTCHHTRR